MAELSEKEVEMIRRRVGCVANHLHSIDSGPNIGSIGLTNASTQNDSYSRTHGDVSNREAVWTVASDESGEEFTDIIYEKAVGEGIAKITINRPERRNAFRPKTVRELARAFADARNDRSVGVIIFTGQGTKAFCSGGDQACRTADGYGESKETSSLNVLDLQVQIRRLPKPVIAMVNRIIMYYL